MKLYIQNLFNGNYAANNLPELDYKSFPQSSPGHLSLAEQRMLVSMVRRSCIPLARLAYTMGTGDNFYYRGTLDIPHSSRLLIAIAEQSRDSLFS